MSLLKSRTLIGLSFFLFFGSALAQMPSGKGNLPLFSFYNTKKLATAICKNANTDEDKAKAIFAWITYHIKYDGNRYKQSSIKRYSSNHILWRKRALCDEYANLFNDLCKAVDVKSFTVDGYFKSATVEFDDTLYTSEHAWNMVKIDQSWQLVDVTISAGYLTYVPSFLERLNALLFRPITRSKLKFIRSQDTSYFLSDPNYFVATHLPSLPEFQNLESPLSLYDFQNCRNNRCYSTQNAQSNLGSIEDWNNSTPKERFIWHADSSVAFNYRNQFVRAFDLQNAAYQTLLEIGYSPKKKEIPYDVQGLKKVLQYIDSSNATIPNARAYIQEEYYHRKYKNQYRHKLAQISIKPVLNQNKRTLTFSKKVPIRNKRKLSNYTRVDANLLTQKSNLQDKKLQIQQEDADSNAESFKNEFNYNEKQISNFLDSARGIEKKLQHNLSIISDSLLPASYIKLAQIERFQDLICQLTMYSNTLRINHFDNLDDELQDAQVFRTMFNDSLKDAIQIRNQNVRECASLELDNNDYLGILKQLHQQTKQMVDANALLGIDNSKMYSQSLQLICANIDSMVANHHYLKEYFVYEAAWAKPILKQSRNQGKRLKAELAYEETRFNVKQNLISKRNLAYKDLLTKLSKTNREYKTSLKPLVKKLSR
ncbi:MAG: hypothetical protein CFE21_13465 [Bacteroidetes bacterium B1(2017)]|nr:MAG: hypothetical protein CFE21_13465 [Bacteroidetes bacterium B1(2017)]